MSDDMTQTTPTDLEGTREALLSAAATDRAAPIFDWQEHRDLLAGCEMTADQEKEFLDILWSLAVSYVDLSLGLHPAQLATGDYDVEPFMKALVEDWSKANTVQEEVE